MSDEELLVGPELEECPVCGAIGLPERIEEHDCEVFLEGRIRDAEQGDGRSKKEWLSAQRNPILTAPASQVLTGLSVSRMEAISCARCATPLREGASVIALVSWYSREARWKPLHLCCSSCLPTLEDKFHRQTVEKPLPELLVLARLGIRSVPSQRRHRLCLSEIERVARCGPLGGAR